MSPNHEQPSLKMLKQELPSREVEEMFRARRCPGCDYFSVVAEFNVSPFIQSDSRHYAMQGVRRWSGEVRGEVFNQATGTLAFSSDSSICVSGVLWLVLFCLFFYLRSSKTSSTVYSRVHFWPPLLSFRHWCFLLLGGEVILRPPFDPRVSATFAGCTRQNFQKRKNSRLWTALWT